MPNKPTTVSLIDSDGILRAEWRGIKVAGHVDEVLKAAKNLRKTPSAQAA